MRFAEAQNAIIGGGTKTHLALAACTESATNFRHTRAALASMMKMHAIAAALAWTVNFIASTSNSQWMPMANVPVQARFPIQWLWRGRRYRALACAPRRRSGKRSKTSLLLARLALRRRSGKRNKRGVQRSHLANIQ